MIVLKEGKIKPKWSIKRKCTGAGNGCLGCKSTLQVDEDDLYVTVSEHYWGETDYFFTFCCPECGEETDIDEKRIPENVKIKVMNNYKRSCQ